MYDTVRQHLYWFRVANDVYNTPVRCQWRNRITKITKARKATFSSSSQLSPTCRYLPNWLTAKVQRREPIHLSRNWSLLVSYESYTDGKDDGHKDCPHFQRTLSSQPWNTVHSTHWQQPIIQEHVLLCIMQRAQRQNSNVNKAPPAGQRTTRTHQCDYDFKTTAWFGRTSAEMRHFLFSPDVLIQCTILLHH